MLIVCSLVNDNIVRGKVNDVQDKIHENMRARPVALAKVHHFESVGLSRNSGIEVFFQHGGVAIGSCRRAESGNANNSWGLGVGKVTTDKAEVIEDIKFPVNLGCRDLLGFEAQPKFAGC